MDPDDGFMTDGSAVVTGWGRAAEAALGYHAAGMLGESVGARLLSPGDSKVFREAARALVSAGTADGSVVMLRVDAWSGCGTAVPVELALTLVEHGSREQVRVDVRSASPDVAAAREMATDTTLLGALLEDSGDGVAVCDAAGRLVLVNDFMRRLGITGERPCPQAWHEGVALTDGDGRTPLPLEQSPLFRALQGEWVPSQALQMGPTPTSTRRLVARSRPLHRPDGRPGGALAIYHDASEEPDLASEGIDVLRDPTTGLLSPTGLRQHLPDAPEVGRPAQLLLLGVEDYRNVSALAGQAAGDALLGEVARRLRALQGPHCVLARAEVDTFAVLSDTDPHLQGDELTAQVHALFQQPWTVPPGLGGAVPLPQLIRASTGLASTPDRSIELWHAAAMALGEGRGPGGDGRGVFRPEMKAALQERVALREDLAAAIEHDQLTLRYQPQVDLRTGTVRGVEALVRWEHPKRGFLPPDEFIPLAEQTGLIVPLGRWVLRAACQQLQSWRDAGLPALRMAVNVSAGQLDPSLVTDVGTILSSTDTAPDLIELEITETVAVRDDTRAHEVLRRLHELGVHLSVDDFGTGYSMLGQLRSFPFSQLKIDKTFIQDLDEVSQAPMITAILAMARALRLEVVAEGVENENQLAFLHAEDCPFAQGYLFARPLDPPAVVNLLRSDQPLPGFATKIPQRTARGEPAGPAELERLARPLLEQVERLTGLESTYLTRITDGVQQVLLARNSGDLDISQGLSVPWADSLCSRALKDGPAIVVDASEAFPDCTAAGQLGIHTYVGAPVRTSDGELFGTLCGASTRTLPLDPRILEMLDLYAQLIGERLSHPALLSSQQQQRAEQQQRARFLAEAEHRIRQPMMVLHGWAQLLARHPDQPTGERHLAVQALLASADEVTEHLERLLDDARSEIVRHTLDLQPVNLADLTRHTLSNAPEQHSHTLDSAIGLDTVVHADPLALERALTDTLSFCASISPPGSPIVISSRRVGTGVEITVRARHGQIPVSMDPFAAFPHAHTPAIGLYTARVLTEAMGGTILTHSDSTRGTFVTIWLRTGGQP